MVLVSAFERRKEGRLNRFDFSFEISFEINRDTVNVGVKDNRCFVNNRAITIGFRNGFEQPFHSRES